jgi:hypothetical protein
VSAANSILEAVRKEIAPDDIVLAAARERLGHIRDAAATLDGALRTFRSGSVAHFTANKPVNDADGGLVLDRRTYPDLGPDGKEVAPTEIVAQVSDIVEPQVRKKYKKVTFGLSKRGLLVEFHDPVLGHEDPSVDLIVTLTRKDQPGLWIPRLDTETWDASDPEAHTKLLEDGYDKTHHALQRAVRLAKAWNTQFKEPALSSFNVEALALEAIDDNLPLAEALAKLFRHGATSLAQALTADPAGVSEPINLLISKSEAVRRLSNAADKLDQAVAAGSDVDAAKAAIADVFFKYVEAPKGALTKSSLAATLIGGTSGVRVGTGGHVSLGTDQGRPVKDTRSFGGA